MTKTRDHAFSPLGSNNIQAFLSTIWQKKPLLIAAAYPNFTPLMSAEELAGLACEEAVEARIVIHDLNNDSWQVRHGPFEESAFSSLPKSHWTLLVQAVDLWLPEAAQLLEDFNFLPRWRRDDLMVSYATKGGGVGPHYDHYDVFLLQASGRRRWEVGGRHNNQSQRVENSPLLQLADFKAEQTWTLGPGDMLYIPPGVGHNGVALDDDCMTYSIGFRAPSHAEILCGITDLASEELTSDQRFKDIKLKADLNPGEIRTQDINQLSQLLHNLADDQALLTRWFGQTVTALKYPDLVEDMANHKRLNATLMIAQAIQLKLRPDLRIAYRDCAEHSALFVNEQEIQLQSDQISLAAYLCNSNPILCSQVPASAANIQLLQQLLDKGVLVLTEMPIKD